MFVYMLVCVLSASIGATVAVVWVWYQLATGRRMVRPCCRHGRFTSLACHNPATWRGDPHSPDAFTRAWRACVVHKMPGDRPLD